MTSKRQPLGARPQRVADKKKKTGGFVLNMEWLEDRYAPVSDLIPGTDLAGPDFTENVPPAPEGAVGVDYLVSVVDNQIQWRPKDGSDPVVEINVNTLFNNDATGIVDSDGNPLGVFDTAPLGLGFGNNPNVPFTQATNVGPGGYVSPDGAGYGAFEARVQYDQYLGRFVVKAEGNNSANSSQIWVAVSRTEDPNDGWNLLSVQTSYVYDPDGRINADDNIPDTEGFLPTTLHNVQFGMTRDALVFSGNVVLRNADSAAFNNLTFDSRIFIVTKQFYYEDAGRTTGIRLTPGLRGAGGGWWFNPDPFTPPQIGTNGTRHFDLMPTHNFGSDENSAFLIEAAPQLINIDQANIFRIDNTPFFNQLFFPLPQTVTGLSPGHGFPTEALASGGDEFGPIAISPNTFSARVSSAVAFTSAVYRPDPGDPLGGVGSIYTAHTLNRDTTGDGIPDRPTVRWYEFTVATPTADPNFINPAFSPTIRQQGGVNADNVDAPFDPGNQFVVDTWAPAITVNALGDMGISFAGSNERMFISAFYTGRFGADALGTTRPAKVHRYGEDLYYRQSAFNVPPWGPYSGIGLDPVDDDQFWIFNAYADERPEGNIFGKWNTTWGAFELVPDNLIFVVDVSLSMEYIHGVDVNLDNWIDSEDDRNGDGVNGSLLDHAIFLIEQMHAQGLLPGQDGAPGSVSLIIFGRGAEAVEIDLSASGGSTLSANPDLDLTGSGVPDFLEAVRSIRTGTAGVISQTFVDPTRSFYHNAVDKISEVAAATGGGVARAIMYSNGAGRTLDPTYANIPPGVRIDTVVLGPYQLVGDISPFTSIADATLSRVIQFNNPRGVFVIPAPVGLGLVPRPGAQSNLDIVFVDASLGTPIGETPAEPGDPPASEEEDLFESLVDDDNDLVANDLVDDDLVDDDRRDGASGDDDDADDVASIDAVFEDEESVV